MTNEQHPITPPTELMQVWEGKYFDHALTFDELLTEVYTAGRNHELEACCEWTRQDSSPEDAASLRIARRPKPPSLKEQALETLRSMQIDPVVINGVTLNAEVMAKYNTIRRALEALPND